MKDLKQLKRHVKASQEFEELCEMLQGTTDMNEKEIKESAESLLLSAHMFAFLKQELKQVDSLADILMDFPNDLSFVRNGKVLYTSETLPDMSTFIMGYLQGRIQFPMMETPHSN